MMKHSQEIETKNNLLSEYKETMNILIGKKEDMKTAKEIVHDYQSGGVEPKDMFVSKEDLLNSLNLIKICCASIKTHLRRKNTIQYDWEYDIKEALSEIETEVLSWQKK